ncbi:MAG: PIN domain-containing protein [Chloroflexi bacterium]|nr:PIN domain-containing protein [Chloroflexota bacterium]
MSRPRVPDTNVLITWLAGPRRRLILFRQIGTGQVAIVSVTLAELYAGVRDRGELFALSQLARIARSSDRLLTPTDHDWIRAGQLIARHGELFGYLDPWDHFGDVLIVLSAAQLGGTVLTADRDFESWVAAAQASGYDVTLTPM